MIDLILKAAKLAFSEDGRKSASAIIDLIRHSPEWRKDLCALSTKIGYSRQEYAAILAGLAVSKLVNLEYPIEAVRAFRTCYNELVSNAFGHGCGKREHIKVTIDIASALVAATVENARGRNFNVFERLESKRAELDNNPRSLRGRGLILISDLSDELQYLPPRGVKAVIYKERFGCDALGLSDFQIIRIRSGERNPSLGRRIGEVDSASLRTTDVVLDVSLIEAVSTLWISIVIELDDLARSSGHHLVVKTFEDGDLDRRFRFSGDRHQSFLLRAGVKEVTTWSEAFRALGKDAEEDQLTKAAIAKFGDSPERGFEWPG